MKSLPVYVYEFDFIARGGGLAGTNSAVAAGLFDKRAAFEKLVGICRACYPDCRHVDIFSDDVVLSDQYFHRDVRRLLGVQVIGEQARDAA